MTFGSILRVHCIFPYMEDEVCYMEKQQKHSKNQKKVEMVGDGVEWCFQGPVYISIYRR